MIEVLLNSPPPPPPPGVPDLEATPGSSGGRTLTVRERMEEHRKSPACASCHKMMDPIGLAMENFDVTGRFRVRDNGMPIDSRGEVYWETSNDDLRMFECGYFPLSDDGKTVNIILAELIMYWPGRGRPA